MLLTVLYHSPWRSAPVHESLTDGKARSAPKSASPLLRLKASPSQEALPRPYPSDLAVRQNTKTGLWPDTKITKTRFKTSPTAKGTMPHRRLAPYAFAKGDDTNQRRLFVNFRVAAERGAFVSDDAAKPEG